MSYPLCRCGLQMALFACLLSSVGCGDQGVREVTSLPSASNEKSSEELYSTSNALFWTSYSFGTIILVNDKRRLIQRLGGVDGQIAVVRLVGAGISPSGPIVDLFVLRDHQAYLAACHLAVHDRSPSDALLLIQELRGLGVLKIQLDEAEEIHVRDAEAMFSRMIEGKASKEEIEKVTQHGDEAARLLALYVPGQRP